MSESFGFDASANYACGSTRKFTTIHMPATAKTGQLAA